MSKIKTPAAIANEVTDTSGLARTGAITLVVFAALFGFWAVLVPIAGAVIAPGQVVSDGNALVIRHELGGVVDGINVSEGEKVEAGDTLIVLNPVKEKAMLDQINTRRAALGLKIARLIAQRDGTEFSHAPDAAKANAKTYGPGLTAEFLADQVTEHKNWTARREAEISAIKAEARALQAERAGLGDEIKAIMRQRQSLKKDVALFAQAVKEGWGRAIELHQMERELARLDGLHIQATAEERALGNRLNEADGRLSAAIAGFAQQVSTELSKARAERAELGQRLQAAQRAVDRVAVRAEVTGHVNKLHINTVGSAVEPFAPLVEIVPDNVPLLVEAKLQPTDIDDVYIGQTSEIVFSAFNRDLVDPVAARVVFVSADSHKDERSGSTYYTARLAVDQAASKALPTIVPGMPVESYFKTTEHTLVQYLVSPITDSLSRAFR